MTNHPNRSRTPFTVRYGNQVAKFSSNRDAMYFAESVSERVAYRKQLVEVLHKTGIVGQYQGGLTTREFELHHSLRDNG